jgi:hypothetical protein
MNATRTVLHPYPASSVDRDRSQSRPGHRERNFGVGYGSSSGYAAANDHRYAQSWAKSFFRCS